MGLAMVHGIAERHGAKMELESKLGHGTTFRFRFAPDAEEIQPAARLSAGAGTLDVLVLDDEPIIAEVIAELLALDGHRVLTATDPREALEMLKASGVDLVITDKSMPAMDGSDFAALAKAASPSIRVLLVTGFGADEPVGDCVDHVIGKPIDIDSLRMAIAETFGLTCSATATL
jgi:CheY-like chemotaxis protein